MLGSGGPPRAGAGGGRKDGAEIGGDADSCPQVVRRIRIGAPQRTGVAMTLVANHARFLPAVPGLRAVQVEQGADVADHYIAARAGEGHLVITADLPLAAEVMGQGAQALSPRGELYDADTIGQRLNMRDFMETMRGSGLHGGGPPPLGERERAAFANALDRWLARRQPGRK